MVKHINVAVDDDLFQRGKDVKDERDWSWEQFYENAVEEFEDQSDE